MGRMPQRPVHDDNPLPEPLRIGQANSVWYSWDGVPVLWFQNEEQPANHPTYRARRRIRAIPALPIRMPNFSGHVLPHPLDCLASDHRL